MTTGITISVIGLLIFGLIVSYAIGFESGIRKLEKESVGSLRVDHSDPDSNGMLFLELDHAIDYLHDGDLVVLRVKVEDYIKRE